MTDEIPNTRLTPEQIRLAIRLEGIFMPHAGRQRDEVYRRQTGHGEEVAKEPIRFVHYTSAEAALGIIKSGRIWMRNAMCMRDHREVQHGFDLLRRFLSDKPRTDAFIAALDECVPGAALEAFTLFNRSWNDIQFHTFIGSISEHDAKEDLHGRLSMWRARGSDAPRVGLVVRIPWFSGGAQALNLIFSPVSYLSEEQAQASFHKVIQNINTNREFLRSMDRARIVGNVFTMLLAGATCLKHEGFRDEFEWRAIYSPKILPSPLMQSSIEVIAGTPQLIYHLPVDASVSASLAELDMARIVDRVIIGPSLYPWVMHEAFVEALTRAGIAEAKHLVVSSGIPMRS